MNSIYKFFKSTRLAIVLILVIILFALLSTLIPQGKSPEDYKAMYSPFLYGLITMSDLQNYTGSILFWVPLVMFILNLGVCTVDRLVKRARNKAVKHFGPDLIHVGLLILAIGALITANLRKEADFTMSTMPDSNSVQLSGGYLMTLTNFEFLQYPDGRPKAWISTVDVTRDGAMVKKAYKIEVNHPLELGLLKVYQTNYAQQAVMNLVDASGKTLAFTNGQSLRSGEDELFFAGAQPLGNGAVSATVETWKGQNQVASQEIVSGAKLADYQVGDIAIRLVTGLRAASDPGFIPVLIALIICSIGLAMTSIYKSKGDI